MGRVCFPADCSSPAEEDKFTPPAPLLPKDPAETGLRFVVGDGDVLDAICVAYHYYDVKPTSRMRKGRLYTHLTCFIPPVPEVSCFTDA
jgi:hypothetical protein